MQRRSRQPHPGEFQLCKSQAPWLKPHYWIFLSSRNPGKRQDANPFKMRIRKLYLCTILESRRPVGEPAIQRKSRSLPNPYCDALTG